MFDLPKVIRFNLRKADFFSKYTNFIETTSVYEQFLEAIDNKNILKKGLWCAEIYDVLDNSGINKVIKRLYALKGMPSYYTVNVNYRKSFFTKIQYARVQIDYTSISVVGTVIFQQNKYIRDITITMTQINSNEFILCYSIHLKKLLKSYAEVHACVLENLNEIKKSRNCTWYMNDDLFEKRNNKHVMRLELEWLRNWFQSTIEQLLYSNIGKMYKLPILFNYNFFEKNDSIIFKLKNPFLTTCYSDKEEKQFLHIESFRNYEGCLIKRYTFGNILTESHFLNYFSKYGNEFYYYIFNTIEIAEIERRLGRYFTSLKRNISIKDHKWLINKIRALKERKVQDLMIEESDIWINFIDGKKTERKLFNFPNNQNKYLEIYEQYLEYIRSMNSLSYNSIILWVTGSTLVATIIGVILAILKS